MDPNITTELARRAELERAVGAGERLRILPAPIPAGARHPEPGIRLSERVEAADPTRHTYSAVTVLGPRIGRVVVEPELDLEDELAYYHARSEADAALVRSRERRRLAEARGREAVNLAVAVGLGAILAVLLILATGQ